MAIKRIYRKTKGNYSVVWFSDGRFAKFLDEDRDRDRELFDSKISDAPLIRGIVDTVTLAEGDDVSLTIALALLAQDGTVELHLAPPVPGSMPLEISRSELRTLIFG